jgi:hypothetical protein
MGIRPIREEGELPAARLYLDDIREIADVLKRNMQQDAAVVNIDFTAKGYRCDSIDDLEKLGKEHGPRTVEFTVGALAKPTDAELAELPRRRLALEGMFRVSRLDTTCYVFGGESASRAEHEIRQILASRSIWWRNAIRSIPFWILVSVVILIGVLEPFLSRTQPRRPFSWEELGRYLLGVGVFLTVAYCVWGEHSVVYLEYSHAKRGIRGFLARNWEKIIIGAICAAIASVVTIVVQRLLK